MQYERKQNQGKPSRERKQARENKRSGAFGLTSSPQRQF